MILTFGPGLLLSLPLRLRHFILSHLVDVVSETLHFLF
jgi:hypothetical protein